MRSPGLPFHSSTSFLFRMLRLALQKPPRVRTLIPSLHLPSRTLHSTRRTAMPSDQISDYATGQAAPVWPADKPLALTLGHFAPAREGHPPAGAVPQDIVPEGAQRPKLFDPLVRLSNSGSALALKNRVVVSPMCQYSARDGFPSVWHLSHLGSWALHGVGSIMIEASGVTPAGRITPQCLGIWKDEQIDAHASLVSALRTVAPGLTVGIQLAHAGRKASTWSPYHRGERQQQHYVTDAEGGWERDVVAPSAIAYGEGWIKPRELSTQEMQEMQDHFVKAADRAFAAGYDFVELHAAHGYFFHSCLSPLSNKRTDAYGGSFEGRTKLLLDTVHAIRAKHPTKSLWVRVSGTDFAEHVEAEGQATWNGSETNKLAPLLDAAGVDVLDVSAGGLVPFQKISPKPAYQLSFAAGVKATKPKKMLVGAVGMMEGDAYPGQVAEDALQRGDCDLIFLARGLMAEPAWAEHAATELMGVRCAGSPQYHRTHPAKRPPPRAQNNN